jgi:uncharacterized small protein (DUF1192 family)
MTGRMFSGRLAVLEAEIDRQEARLARPKDYFAAGRVG